MASGNVKRMFNVERVTIQGERAISLDISKRSGELNVEEVYLSSARQPWALLTNCIHSITGGLLMFVHITKPSANIKGPYIPNRFDAPFPTL